MSISFVGPAGSCEFPWIHYALLRDNILHHFDHGQMSPSFHEIYAIADTLGGPPVDLSALTLRAELCRAKQLCITPAHELAVSAATKSVLCPGVESSHGPATQIVGPHLNFPWLVTTPDTLGDVFGGLIEALIEITAGATATDKVQILDN